MSGEVNARVDVTTTEILQGAGKVKIDGVEMGGFQGGVRITQAKTAEFIRSDCKMGEIDSELMSVEMTVDVELEQSTLERIAVAYGISSSSVLSGASSKTLNIILPQDMREVGLVLEGMSGTNRALTRTYTFPKCVAIGSSQTTLRRATKQTTPVQFKVLIDSAGSFGSYVDNTIA